MSRYHGFGDQQVSNGVLFIIALFFLSCAGCGAGYSGTGYSNVNYGGSCGCRR